MNKNNVFHLVSYNKNNQNKESKKQEKECAFCVVLDGMITVNGK